MTFEQWWNMATSLWVRELNKEKGPLVLLWPEAAIRSYNKGVSPQVHVYKTMRAYSLRIKGRNRKLKRVIGV